jgi:alpha-D-ribose 1-methylphosphonate 5-triphosphate diphosphatase PhnM
MPPVGFETTILVSERPKTHALDRTATGIGSKTILGRPNILVTVLHVYNISYTLRIFKNAILRLTTIRCKEMKMLP